MFGEVIRGKSVGTYARINPFVHQILISTSFDQSAKSRTTLPQVATSLRPPLPSLAPVSSLPQTPPLPRPALTPPAPRLASQTLTKIIPTTKRSLTPTTRQPPFKSPPHYVSSVTNSTNPVLPSPPRRSRSGRRRSDTWMFTPSCQMTSRVRRGRSLRRSGRGCWSRCF